MPPRHDESVGVMKAGNAESYGRLARWMLRCVAGVICALSCYLFAVFFADLVSCCPYIYRNLFLKYDYSRVFAGAACDQGGLTKTAVIVFLLEAWTGFNWYMCRLVSKWRIWWFAHTFVFLLVFVFPILLSAWFTWELWRYIAVMGITVNRAKAVLLAILFFFSPAFCAVKWIVGRMPRTKNLRAAVICLFVALAVVLGINVAARRSLASHPRPTICEPYGVSVPPAR